MRMKKIAAVILAASLSCGGAMSAIAGTWIQTGVLDWKYQKDDGNFMTDDWLLHTDGKWYYLGADGMMKRGWFLDKNGKWYFMDSNGAMQTGLINVDGKVYWMEPSGELFIGDKQLPIGLTFNFGLNGCTNGSPYTGNKFYGNGNPVLERQAVSGGTTYYTVSIPEAVKTEINNITNDVSGSLEELKYSDIIISVTVENMKTVSETKATIAVKVEVKDNLTDTEVGEVRNAVDNSVDAIMNRADPAARLSFKLGGLTRSYTQSELTGGVLDSLLNKWVTVDKLNNSQITTGSITVVIDGVTLTYNISI